MAIEALDNLVRIGQLKRESTDFSEVKRMLTQAKTRCDDAQAVKSVPPPGVSSHR